MDERRWQPQSPVDYEQVVGLDVYTRDGERIGRVERIIYPTPEMEAEAHLGHFLVVLPDAPGNPLGSDAAYVPETAVALVTPDAVELAVEAKEVPDQRWAHLPASLIEPPEPLPEELPPSPEVG